MCQPQTSTSKALCTSQFMGRCPPPNPRGPFLARERDESSPGRPRPPLNALFRSPTLLGWAFFHIKKGARGAGVRNALHNELQDVILNWAGDAKGRQEGPLFLRGVGARAPHRTGVWGPKALTPLGAGIPRRHSTPPRRPQWSPGSPRPAAGRLPHPHGGPPCCPGPAPGIGGTF